jgi:hypothetical protein
MVFKIVVEKVKISVCLPASIKLFTNFENPFSNCREPTVAIGPFALQQMKGRRWKKSTNHQEGNSKEGFSKHFKN